MLSCLSSAETSRSKTELLLTRPDWPFIIRKWLKRMLIQMHGLIQQPVTRDFKKHRRRTSPRSSGVNLYLVFLYESVRHWSYLVATQRCYHWSPPLGDYRHTRNTYIAQNEACRISETITKWTLITSKPGSQQASNLQNYEPAIYKTIKLGDFQYYEMSVCLSDILPHKLPSSSSSHQTLIRSRMQCGICHMTR